MAVAKTYLSAKSLAAQLDVSLRTVIQMRQRGVLPPPYKFSNGCARWKWADVEAALALCRGERCEDGEGDHQEGEQ